MEGEHYFSARPSGEAALRDLDVTLAGTRVRLTTASGIFSPDRIDTGTQVLLSSVPTPPPSGNLLDIGCGWGPIALTLALESPHSTVWAVDVNERALDLVRRNAESLHLSNVNAVRPEDVPDSVEFTTIWSNPPIRVGKNELHDLLQRWMPRIEEGGDAWLVVQKNLGADSLLRWMEAEFDGLAFQRASTNKGFRILHARRRVHRES
jgi:16S rRNA (guanine1207-N2)-methyltransferase